VAALLGLLDFGSRRFFRVDVDEHGPDVAGTAARIIHRPDHRAIHPADGQHDDVAPRQGGDGAPRASATCSATAL
ncbi:MAG: hypothetical protein UZ03_NOB001003219, partial [Nitrospira sp. OLB3]